DVADLGFLEQEITDLKKEIESFDNFSGNFVQPVEQHFQEFLTDKHIITAPGKRAETKLEDITAALEKSRIAQAYLDYAAQFGVSLQMNAQVREAYYDRKALKILINPHLQFEDQILLAARELRRHWQHRK